MANSWWEIQVLGDPALEESVFWRLQQFGCSGTATERQGQNLLMRAYLLQTQAQVLDLAALSLWLSQDAALLGISPPITRWNLIDEEDWSSSWKQHWQPLILGDRFLIQPAWLEPPAAGERLVLRLDPGLAFGTGTHATTQLCLEALEMRLSRPQEGLVLADIGCGSGILSIGAILLGAEKVYGVDIDPLAVQAAQSNRDLNGISPERLAIHQGSVSDLIELLPTGVDGIVCNILADVIMAMVPALTTLAKPKSWAIFSGILVEQAQQVGDILEQNGWTVAALWQRESWCCLNVRR